MEKYCQKYEQEVKKAKETIIELENEILQIRKKLEKSPNNAIYLQELKKIDLDMTITANELEHSQSALEKCLSTS